MKTLELKHLAPYLPYRLNMLSSEMGIWELNPCSFQEDGTPRFGVSKPLLIPLSAFNDSDADREIFKTGNYYTSVYLNKTKDLPQWEFEILCKHHFDVFGLIDAGLALNKLNHPIK